MGKFCSTFLCWSVIHGGGPLNKFSLIKFQMTCMPSTTKQKLWWWRFFSRFSSLLLIMHFIYPHCQPKNTQVILTFLLFSEILDFCFFWLKGEGKAQKPGMGWCHKDQNSIHVKMTHPLELNPRYWHWMKIFWEVLNILLIWIRNLNKLDSINIGRKTVWYKILIVTLYTIFFSTSIVYCNNTCTISKYHLQCSAHQEIMPHQIKMQYMYCESMW